GPWQAIPAAERKHWMHAPGAMRGNIAGRPTRPTNTKPRPMPLPRVSSNGDDWAIRVQAPEVVRIACDDGVSPLPGQNHDRSVDNVRGLGGAAEFSTGTGKLFIERNNLDFVTAQEPRQ